MPRLAIIGGTGFEEPSILGVPVEPVTVRTRWGSVPLAVGRVRGEEVAFLSRHGPGHTVPPHRIPYLANIGALKELGVQRIAATAAVGSLRAELATGTLLAVDQFIDWTRRRPTTWFTEEGAEGQAGSPVGEAAAEPLPHPDADRGRWAAGSGETGAAPSVVHVDFSEPYCPEIRRALLSEAARMGVELRPSGCYVGVEGPRFETPAEVRALALLGGDVVGMTGLPEAVLAREAGLCYATVAVVTNPGAGLGPAPISHEEVSRVMEALRPRVVQLMLGALTALPQDRTRCPCGRHVRL